MKCRIIVHGDNPQRVIIALPGRGQKGESILRFVSKIGIPDAMVIGMTPPRGGWYPPPSSPWWQDEAVNGLATAVDCVLACAKKASKTTGVPFSEMALIGYSAGAVVAIQTALKEPFRACVSLCGAVLQPDLLASSKEGTRFCLQHNMTDPVFKWHERYLPMKEAMLRLEYPLTLVEGKWGGHDLTQDQLTSIRDFLLDAFGLTRVQRMGA